MQGRAFLAGFFAAAICIAAALTGPAAAADCPYLITDKTWHYYDYSSLYTQSDMAVIAQVQSVSPRNSSSHTMTLKILAAVKGPQDSGMIEVPYTDDGGQGNWIKPTTRPYFFFLKKTGKNSAERMLCPQQIASGWINHGMLFFSEQYSIPIEGIKPFLESDKAVVPAP